MSGGGLAARMLLFLSGSVAESTVRVAAKATNVWRKSKWSLKGNKPTLSGRSREWSAPKTEKRRILDSHAPTASDSVCVAHFRKRCAVEFWTGSQDYQDLDLIRSILFILSTTALIDAFENVARTCFSPVQSAVKQITLAGSVPAAMRHVTIRAPEPGLWLSANGQSTFPAR